MLFRSPYEVAVEKAKADIGVVQADLTNAHDRVERNRPLVEVSAISPQEFDQLVANERSLTAQLAARRAMLDEANLNLSFTRILSPVAGRTSATTTYSGTYVTPQQLLVTVRQLDPLWVEFNPVATDLPALRKMMESGDRGTTAALPGGEWSRSGKVVFVDNTVNRETSTIRTRIELPNPDRVMVPGAYVNVHLKVDELADALSVPEQAIVYQTAAATLWTVDKDGKARQKVVKTGPRGGAGIVIAEGLSADDVVVVEGIEGVASPNNEAQIKGFKLGLGKVKGVTLKEVKELKRDMSGDPREWPAGRAAQIASMAAGAGAVVLFVNLPQSLPAPDLAALKGGPAKLVVVGTQSPLLQNLVSSGVVKVAIVARTPPSPAPSGPESPVQWFARVYQVIQAP